MTTSDSSSMSYVVGPDDRILAVEAAWNEFATAQGAPDLTGDQVLGKSLHDSIADPGTREIYAMLFDAARQTHRPVTVPFRCDSADVRRYMILTITPQPGGLLRMSTILEREEARPAVAILDPATPRTAALLTICGWCKKIPLPSGAWADVEEAMTQLGLLQQTALPKLTHGVCPACSTALLAQVNAAAAARGQTIRQ